ncbi:MAG TPA: hypothetical protein VMU51_38755 [Mycobacteriales bacterium]|nr:hypothetical protein [Mycobacteriales bacterium]
MTEIEDVLRLDETVDAGSAARAAEEALRTAVHATDASTGWPGLTGAADVYAVLGALGYTLELLPQLLDQLTGWLAEHAPRLQVDGALGAPAELVAAVRADLDGALAALADGRDRLATAQAALAAVSGPVNGPVGPADQSR